ncbi:phosphotransferase enzyme family protein [Paenirhodobacter populi]|uniref:Aminoglycoside phosphotransferase n=1 Tax=Paenirhodobacter populi TaxID=2306993 RepID=A0A443ITB9_9RHOB|nr:phosphotransferase [Sinirhodobacter populi]RWR10981.1 aminoglycoside phosphotransferase [Sinirhodobacter populi]
MLYAGDVLSRLEGGLRTALPAWGVAADASVRLLTISENATFLVEEPSGAKRVFRVHRPGYHSKVQIESELSWIAALRAEGVIDTPAPVAALDGTLLQAFRDGNEERFAACFEYIPGHAPDADADLARWFRVLGAITAKMHAHAHRFSSPDWFERKHWDWETTIGPKAWWGDWRLAGQLDAEGHAVIAAAAERLKEMTDAFGQGPDRFGLVHCDMRAANLLVSGERLFVIDFDDCGFSWFGYDFAASVSFIEDDPALPALRQAWVEGYRSVAPLAPEVEAMLPAFVMLRRIQLTAWLATHSETPTAAALPDYANGTVALARAFLEHEGKR